MIPIPYCTSPIKSIKTYYTECYTNKNNYKTWEEYYERI